MKNVVEICFPRRKIVVSFFFQLSIPRLNPTPQNPQKKSLKSFTKSYFRAALHLAQQSISKKEQSLQLQGYGRFRIFM